VYISIFVIQVLLLFHAKQGVFALFYCTSRTSTVHYQKL